MKTKKLLALALSILMIISLCPTQISAALVNREWLNDLHRSFGKGFYMNYDTYAYCNTCNQQVYIRNDYDHSIYFSKLDADFSTPGKVSFTFVFKFNDCTDTLWESKETTQTVEYNCEKDVFKVLFAKVNDKYAYAAVRREATKHTGGNATCMTADNCTRCGTSYIGAHSYSSDWTQVNVDGTLKHRTMCTVSGCTSYKTEENCTPAGTATCIDKEICNTCKGIYGDVNSNKHASTTTYFKKTDENTHSEYYSCCDAFKGTANHTEDIKATCVDVATCNTCESTYGEKNPSNHASEETYTQLIDDDIHGIYHTCCDALETTEAHSPDNAATCTAQQHCSVCKSTYGETNGENHTGELVWDTTDYDHIKKWTCCGATEGVSETHTPEFSVSEDGAILSASCVTCEKDLGSCSIDMEDSFVYDGKAHEAERNGYIDCAYGDDWPRITYWQNGEQLNTVKTGGISHAGTYTVRLGVADHSTYVEKEVTIRKRELTVAELEVSYKTYDGTNKVNVYGVNFNNVVEGEEIFADVDGDAVVSDNKVGYYETVTGIEAIRTFTSYIESYHGDNYFVTVDPKTEYPIANGGLYIEPRTVYVTAENQSITVGDEIDQSKYTLENFLDGYELTGIKLENNGTDNIISVNTEETVITLDGEDLTENFTFSTYSGILETVCANHKFDADGFCASRTCDIYQTPKYTLDEFGTKTYEITNAGELYFYAEQVNVYGYNGNNAVLCNNIRIPATVGKGGDVPDWTPINNLYATFDGQGHFVSGLYCKSDANYVGMFGYTGYYPIKNLIITNSYFEGPGTVGALAGYSQAEISNCGITDTVEVVGEASDAAYLVGYNASSINNCFAMGSCIVGYSSSSYGATINNCYYIAEEDTDGLDGTAALNAEAFANGKAAYLLQAGVQPEDIYDAEGNYVEAITPEVWGQEIGADSHPVPGGAKVYEDTHNENKAYRNEIDGFEVIYFGQDAKSATVVFESPGAYTVIFADYGENNNFENIDTIEITVDEAKAVYVSTEKNFTLTTDDKIMLWSDMTTLVPKCEAYIVK